LDLSAATVRGFKFMLASCLVVHYLACGYWKVESDKLYQRITKIHSRKLLTMDQTDSAYTCTTIKL
jgi:hypothetical protein